MLAIDGGGLPAVLAAGGACPPRKREGKREWVMVENMKEIERMGERDRERGNEKEKRRERYRK